MKTFKSTGKTPQSSPGKLDQELRKVESQIESVSNRLTDSGLELGVSVRLSVQLRELEAYVRGIRFAMGQAPPWENALEV
jgi:hypothetical protein